MRKDDFVFKSLLAGPVKKGLSYFPCFVCKYPLFAGLKLILIMPIVGLLNFITMRQIHKLFWPLLGLIFVGLFHSLYFPDSVVFIRLCQLFGMVCFAQYLTEKFTSDDFERLEQSLLILSALFLVGEIFISGFIPDKEILPGVRVYRLLGIVGESNYSGLICALITISLWLRRRSWWVLLGVATVLITSSRISFLILLCGGAWSLFSFLNANHQRKTLKTLAVIILLYPLLLWGVEKVLPLEAQKIVNHLYSGRFTIHSSYMAMFFDNPFGVGYFRGPELFADYSQVGSKLMLSGYLYPIDHIPVYQQHGLFIQVLSEFGIIGYALFVVFVWQLLSNALANGTKVAYLLIVALGGFLTLNTLSDFALFYSVVRFSLSSNKYSD